MATFTISHIPLCRTWRPLGLFIHGAWLDRTDQPCIRRSHLDSNCNKLFYKMGGGHTSKESSKEAVANFIRENIAFCFGIPYKIVTDNGTSFVNKEICATLSRYGVKCRRFTPYYPQGNGQAKAINKTLLWILSKMVNEYVGGWKLHLFNALWAYRILLWSVTGFSQYSLVYDAKEISPTELEVPTVRVLVVNNVEWAIESCGEMRIVDLEAEQEKRELFHQKVYL